MDEGHDLRTTSENMDHTYIEEHGIAERYAAGRLLPEEQSRFEAHFVDCPDCLDRVEQNEGLRGAFRALSAEEPRPLRNRNRGAERRSHFGWGQAALAASLVLALTALLGKTARDARQAQRELEQVRSASASLQQELAQEQAAARREHKALAGLEEELERVRRPQVGLPVFALNLERGGAANPREIRLPTTSQWVVLSVDREEPARFETYRVTLLATNGSVIWREPAIRPASREAVAIAFHSSLLVPGDYLLRVEGVAPTRREKFLASYRFRAIEERKNSPPVR